ncbi:MAG TPA: ATP-binding protein, partial [Flavobacteriales bacterium]|nr:ATP-binding protein [Flavobacteriales bacterium]
ERRLTNYVFAGTVLLMLFLLFTTFSNFTEYRDGVEEARRLNRLKSSVDGIMSSLRDAENGLRGYLITHDKVYLGPYRTAMPEYVRSRLEAVKSVALEERPGLDSLTLLADQLRERWALRLAALDGGRDILLTPEQMTDDRLLMERARRAHRQYSDELTDRRERMLLIENEVSLNAPRMIVIIAAIALLALGSLFWRLSTALRNSDRAWLATEAKNKELAHALDRIDYLRVELRNVLDAAPNGVMTMRSVRDETGRIIDFEWTTANAMVIEMMGQGDLVGKRLLHTLPEKLGQGNFAEYVLVVETGKELKREVSREFRGAETWFRKHALRTEDGFLATFSDITDEKRMEQARLEGDRLALTSQITRTVAHEVRNPLTNIHLAVEQLQEEQPRLAEEAQPYFRIVERNLHRIGDLIKGMLESTRKHDLQVQACTMKDLVEDVVAHISDRIELKQMRVELEIPDGLPDVMVDSDLMMLAITNIAVNAVEAMRPGHGLLRFEAARRGEEVALFITDNGHGMAEEGLQRIFEPFYSGRPGGLGLGLTATRSILLSHDVRMEVRSTLGEGTTFELRFPERIILA